MGGGVLVGAGSVGGVSETTGRKASDGRFLSVFQNVSLLFE